MHPRNPRNSLLLAALLAVATPIASLADWPRWMGDKHDGVYREAGVATEIPSSGLKVKWRTPIEGGYAGPAVADGRVYVFDYVRKSGEPTNDPQKRVELKGEERLLALDATTGNVVWEHRYDCTYTISYPCGPRCTPTVAGGKVYILGSQGDLRCLDAATGKLVWSKSFTKDFAAAVPLWGFSSHPLIDGDLLYTMVGGKGQGIVAFDKNTGDVRWKALDTKAGYAPPAIITAGGTRQLLVFHPEGITSVSPTDGTQYWSEPIKPLYEMSVARPMLDKDMLYLAGIGKQSLLLKLAADKPTAEIVWRDQERDAIHPGTSTPLFVNGVIYGSDCDRGELMALDAATGKRLWSTFAGTRPDETRRVPHGSAFLTRIGDTDRYYILSEVGDFIVAELTRDGYKEHGRQKLLEPTGEAFGRSVVWSHPAYANKTAYARNDKEIVALDLSK
ncbi:MAG: PQQ-binding-like beta-propeller repeat protein [Phycisphaerae bacterium]